MDKFTLEAAQKGKELITRDGRPARYVATLSEGNQQFPVVVEVFQFTEEDLEDEEESKEELLSQDENWNMENFTIEGEFLPPFEQPQDLFIKTL